MGRQCGYLDAPSPYLLEVAAHAPTLPPFSLQVAALYLEYQRQAVAFPRGEARREWRCGVRGGKA